MAKHKEERKASMYWTAIAWADSELYQWEEDAKEMCVPVIVGPLHDKDLKSDGSPDKPHRHVIFVFKGSTSYNVFSRYCEMWHLQCYPESKWYLAAVHDLQKMERYLLHMDESPIDKYPYHLYDSYREQIKNYTLRDYWLDIVSSSDYDSIVDEVEEFIDRQDITSYAKLLGYLRHCKPSWAKTVRTHTIHFKGYLTSRQYDKEHVSADVDESLEE